MIAMSWMDGQSDLLTEMHLGATPTIQRNNKNIATLSTQHSLQATGVPSSVRLAN